MIRICFVCLGNICRSPMAEFIMKDKVNKLGLSDKFYIESRATSYEEDGNDIYPPAKRMLDSKGVPYSGHRATRLEMDDYNKFDYFICMDHSNLNGVIRIFNNTNKASMLLDRDIRDPWYSGNFNDTYDDLDKGIDKLINKFKDDVDD